MLCDISGSMSHVHPHFPAFLPCARPAAAGRPTFLFGTRLTNVTRQFRLTRPRRGAGRLFGRGRRLVGRHAHRLGAPRLQPRLVAPRCWGRVRSCSCSPTGSSATAIDDLAREMDRLHRSCRRLIWLNPLLGYDGFEAKARGIRAMLPHVDELRSVHSLEAVADICRGAFRQGAAASRSARAG